MLPIGQGFFARVAAGLTSGTMTFRNSQRLTAPSATTFQRPTAETRPLVQLTLQGAGSLLLDEATVYFENGATSSFDPSYDAQKLPSGVATHQLLLQEVATGVYSLRLTTALGTVVKKN